MNLILQALIIASSLLAGLRSTEESKLALEELSAEEAFLDLGSKAHSAHGDLSLPSKYLKAEGQIAF